jgi:hypothetical protein
VSVVYELGPVQEQLGILLCKTGSSVTLVAERVSVVYELDSESSW